MKNKRATIADIAAKSGYSKTAVSFAFNSPDKISKKARGIILQTAKDLDYIPDPSARNLARGRHMTIGFLLPQKFTQTLGNPYLMGVIRGAGSVCEKYGYNLTLIPPLNSSVAEALKSATIDGAISLGHPFDKEVMDVLDRRELPLVAVDGATTSSITSINIDDEKASELSLMKALEKGHRKFRFIKLPEQPCPEGMDPMNFSTVSKRMKGYENALSHYGLTLSDFPCYEADASYLSGKEIGDEIFSDLGNTTCVLSMADIIAVGVYKSAMEHGLRIPEDCSLVGFDDISSTGTIFPELTTIRQSSDEKGRMAAEALFEIIDKAESAGKNYEIPYSFIPGCTLKDLN